eukprot:6491657-Amphidinium_carterae.1
MQQRQRERDRKEVEQKVEEHFLKNGVPATASRTNLGKSVHSQLLGLYTRRGVGVTKRTVSFSLLEELHALARTCSESPSYTSISVNVITDADIQMHKDANNLGDSTVFVCGKFTGGEFVQGQTRIGVRRGWFKFFGHVPHCVNRVHGTRVSIVYHVPNGVHGITRQVKDQLTGLGFPIARVLEQGIPKMLAGQSCACSAIAETEITAEQVAGKMVLIECACFGDSLLSAEHELKGGISVRLGLPSTDLTTEHGKRLFTRVLRIAAEHAQSVIVWFSIPCSAWSSLQYLNENRYGSDWLRERRNKALPLVQCAVHSVKQVGV